MLLLLLCCLLQTYFQVGHCALADRKVKGRNMTAVTTTPLRSAEDGHGETHELAVHAGVVEAGAAVQPGDARHLHAVQ